MTRKSKRELERALDGLEADLGPPGAGPPEEAYARLVEAACDDEGAARRSDAGDEPPTDDWADFVGEPPTDWEELG